LHAFESTEIFLMSKFLFTSRPVRIVFRRTATLSEEEN
jgi:hypothetical protein